MMLNLYGKRCLKRQRLPEDFVPGTFSVLCGRGKSSTASTGNKHLKSLILKYLQPYSLAETKVQKSAIVSKIINEVKEVAPDGGAFVRLEDDGSWWDLGDAFAREKVGCMFRDILHQQYRSSTRSKLARKKAERRAQGGSRNRRVPTPSSNTMSGSAPQSQSQSSQPVLRCVSDQDMYDKTSQTKTLYTSEPSSNISLSQAAELLAHDVFGPMADENDFLPPKTSSSSTMSSSVPSRKVREDFGMTKFPLPECFEPLPLKTEPQRMSDLGCLAPLPIAKHDSAKLMSTLDEACFLATLGTDLDLSQVGIPDLFDF